MSCDGVRRAIRRPPGGCARSPAVARQWLCPSPPWRRAYETTESPCRLPPSPNTILRLWLPDRDWEKLAPTSCLRAPSECTLLRTIELPAYLDKAATRGWFRDPCLDPIGLVALRSSPFNHFPGFTSSPSMGED